MLNADIVPEMAEVLADLRSLVLNVSFFRES